MYSMVTIEMVLKNIEDYEWFHDFYLPDNEEWTLDTKGIVWDPDDVEDDKDEVPKIALDNGLLCFLNIATIQEIIDFANRELEDCTIDDLLQSFLYYYDNDAFLVLNKKNK